MIPFKNECDMLITQHSVDSFEDVVMFLQGDCFIQFADELEFQLAEPNGFAIMLNVLNYGLLNPQDKVTFINPKNEQEYSYSLEFLFNETNILAVLQPALKQYRLQLLKILDANVESERTLIEKLAKLEGLRVINVAVMEKNEEEILNEDLELVERIEANKQHNAEQRETILAEIDKALDSKNEAEFNRLTELLKEYT